MSKQVHGLTQRIVCAMLLGAVFGWLSTQAPDVVKTISFDVFDTGAQVFLRLIMMVVVPVVFVSVTCGVAGYSDVSKLGKIGIKTFSLYVLTTVLAIALALSVSTLFGLGAHKGAWGSMVQTAVHLPAPPSLKAVIIDMIPLNPIQSLASGSMLQVIIFAIFLGVAMLLSGRAGARLLKGLESFNKILMVLVYLVISLAPLGVFCLIFRLVVQAGLASMLQVLHYSLVVIVVLLLQAVCVYGGFLAVLTRLSPRKFFLKMLPAMVFAFGVSSSSASIPVVLKAVRERLGVSARVASFAIPLGATVNMDGTAIMQGVATVFIANAYHISLTMPDYLTVMLMATLASIGTAGVPGVGLMTLAMVLKQIGVPVEGIALILGVDRILDMLRTAINITGDAMVACVVDHQQGTLRRKRFNRM